MSRTLQRTLGPRDLILIVIGTVIGSGIFIVPASVLRESGGDVRLALVVWLAAGVLSLLGALTYGELGAGNPEAGGLYVYIRDAFGPLPAFLYGWTAFFVIGTGSVATLAVAFTGYLGQFVPVSPITAKVVAALMILVIMAINVRGVRHSAHVQNWTTGVKLGALAVMSVVLIAVGRGYATPVAAPAAGPVAGAFSILSGVGAAMIAVLWAYEGWQYVTFSAGETLDPQRIFPRAIVAGTAVIIAIYLLANLGYLAALGADRAQHTDRIAADAVTALFGPAAGKVIAAVILVSMFSAANGLTLTSPRMYFAMAQDGVFFEKLAEVHPRFGTPAFAVVAGSAWAMLLAVSGTFEQLLTYVVFAGWIFYALGALSIFSYRRSRRRAGEAPTFRVPGYPVTPILFVAAAAAIVLNTLVTQPGRAFVGLGIVLLGTPVFFFWRARRSRLKPRLTPSPPAPPPTTASARSGTPGSSPGDSPSP
jgi:APA family basic amino acid/polyamine antiporter